MSNKLTEDGKMFSAALAMKTSPRTDNDCDFQALDLLCTENDVLKRAYDDPVLVKQPRILQNLLAAEDRYVPNATYFAFQTEVKPFMRREVITWMNAVCCEQCCAIDVFSLAVNYVDRYLSAVDVKKGRLQLLSAVSMFIASKLKESIPKLSVEKLVYYTNYSITVDDILDWELLVLQVLKWDISAITPSDFIGQILSTLHFGKDKSEAVAKRALHFIQLCAANVTFIAIPPSMMAAASITATLCETAVMSSDEERRRSRSCQTALIQKLHEITRIDVDCLLACQDQIELIIRMSAIERSDCHDTEAGHTNKSCSSPDTSSEEMLTNSQATTPSDVMDVVLCQ